MHIGLAICQPTGAATIFLSAAVIVSRVAAFFNYLRVRRVPFKGHGYFTKFHIAILKAQ